MMINLRKVSTVGIIASCAVFLSACSLYNPSTGSQTTGTQTDQQTGGQTSQNQQQGEVAATITFSDNGVNPATVTIKVGQAITWTNSSSKTIQVASDPHPTHTDNRELTRGDSTIQLAPSESVTVTLTKAGTWGYHDHLNPTMTGTVVVE